MLSSILALIAVAPGERPVQPGQGFATATRSLRESCVTGDLVYAGAPTATLRLDHQLSRDDLQQLTQVTFGGGVDLFVISGRVETALTSKLQGQELRETLLYDARYRSKDVRLENPRLTDLGKSLRARGDQALEYLSCGDTYVSALHSGGHVRIWADLYFKDQQSLSTFRTTVTVSVLGIKAVRTFVKEQSQRDGISRVQIDAEQQGGDPTALQQLLTALPRSCPPEAFDPCADSLERLATYAMSEFPAQMESGATVLSFETAATPRATAITQDLADLLGLLNEDRKLLENDLGLYEPWSAHARALTEFEATHWLDTRDQALRGGDIPALRSAYEGQRQVLIRDPGFVDYCGMKDQGTAVDRTVNAILQVLGFNGRGALACDQARVRLQSLRALPLAGRQLGSVLPLKDAPQLEALDLSQNALLQVRPIGLMKGLKILNLEHNQLRDLFDLRSLSLRDFNSAYNALVPGRWPTVTGRLFAHGNGFVSGAIQLPGVEVIDTEGALCALQRRRLWETGVISDRTYAAYEQADFLPVVDGDGIDIKPCRVAAPSFDLVTAGLFPAVPLR